MNEQEKNEYLKKEITGLKYLNSILWDAISLQQEIKDVNCEFLYVNKIIASKIDDILKVFEE